MKINLYKRKDDPCKYLLIHMNEPGEPTTYEEVTRERIMECTVGEIISSSGFTNGWFGDPQNKWQRVQYKKEKFKLPEGDSMKQIIGSKNVCKNKETRRFQEVRLKENGLLFYVSKVDSVYTYLIDRLGNNMGRVMSFDAKTTGDFIHIKGIK